MKSNPSSKSLITRLTRIEDKLDSVADMLARHDETLFGNGKPGLLRQVDRLKTYQKLTWAAASFCITTVLALIARAFHI